MDIKKKLKELEKRIELLENKGPRGTRLKEIADWIEGLFEKEERISIHKVMTKGKKLGYSEQMIQRARRSLLSDRIGYMRVKGTGWLWAKFEE